MADKLKNAMISAIILIVLLTVAFFIWGSIVPEAQIGGNALNDTNLCQAEGCFYNTSGLPSPGDPDGGSAFCETGVATNLSCATFAGSIPLSGLFSGDGVVFVIIMAALFLAVLAGIFILMKRSGSK